MADVHVQPVPPGVGDGVGQAFPGGHHQQIGRLRILRHVACDGDLHAAVFRHADQLIGGRLVVLLADLVPERRQRLLPDLHQRRFPLRGTVLRAVPLGVNDAVAHLAVDPHFGGQDLLLPGNVHHVFGDALVLVQHPLYLPVALLQLRGEVVQLRHIPGQKLRIGHAVLIRNGGLGKAPHPAVRETQGVSVACQGHGIRRRPAQRAAQILHGLQIPSGHGIDQPVHGIVAQGQHPIGGKEANAAGQMVKGFLHSAADGPGLSERNAVKPSFHAGSPAFSRKWKYSSHVCWSSLVTVSIGPARLLRSLWQHTIRVRNSSPPFRPTFR